MGRGGPADERQQCVLRRCGPRDGQAEEPAACLEHWRDAEEAENGRVGEAAVGELERQRGGGGWDEGRRWREGRGEDAGRGEVGGRLVVPPPPQERGGRILCLDDLVLQAGGAGQKHLDEPAAAVEQPVVSVEQPAAAVEQQAMSDEDLEAAFD